MVLLKERVLQFRKTDYAAHHRLYAALQKGQDPEILFITCSDSRILPSQLIQARPGEVFTIRNAGNIVPADFDAGGEGATIEYALTALNIKDIIICGHSQCGAMSGLLYPELINQMPAVKQWLKHAPERQCLIDKYQSNTAPQLLDNAVKENVLLQLEHLQQHPCIKKKLAEGTLTIHGWVYQFESGVVLNFNTQTKAFEPLLTDESTNSLSPGPIQPVRSYSLMLRCLNYLAMAAGAVLAFIGLITFQLMCTTIAATMVITGSAGLAIENGFFSYGNKRKDDAKIEHSPHATIVI